MRALFLLATLATLSCSNDAAEDGSASAQKQQQCDAAQIQEEIEAVIQQGVEATRNEDIDLYMKGIPDDFHVEEDDGSITTKEQMRKNALRDWAVIDETLNLTITITKLEINAACDQAIVFTDQRWERVMRRPDDSGTDVILTTQKHRELWRKTTEGWLNEDIEELGGEIFVNGEPYTP